MEVPTWVAQLAKHPAARSEVDDEDSLKQHIYLDSLGFVVVVSAAEIGVTDLLELAWFVWAPRDASSGVVVKHDTAAPVPTTIETTAELHVRNLLAQQAARGERVERELVVYVS